MERKLTQNHAICIQIMFVLGTSVLSGVARSAKENAWICIIGATIIAIPFVLIYAALMNQYRGMNIFMICESIYGKVIGKIISAILVFNGFYLGCVLLRRIIEFMYLTDLTDTPYMAISLLPTLLAIYIAKKGVVIFGTWCRFYITIVIGLFITELIVLIPNREINYLYPLFYEGTEPVIAGVFEVLAFPILQIAHTMTIYDELDTKASIYKIFLYGLLIASGLLLISTLDTLTVVGGEIYNISYYPVYLAFRRVNIGFIKRIEILAVLSFLIVCLVKFQVSIFNITRGIKSIFSLKTDKNIVVAVSFLVSVLGFISYENLIEAEEYFSNIYMSYSIVINGFLPVFIYLSHLVKSSITKSFARRKQANCE